MAQKVTVEFIDDITGQPADTTISFSFDGVDYEIDLSNETYASVREQFRNLIGSARVVKRTRNNSRGPGSGKQGGSGLSKAEMRAAREWGHANGWKPSDRGRLAQGLVDAWRQSTTGAATTDTTTPGASPAPAPAPAVVTDETGTQPAAVGATTPTNEW